MSIIAAQDYWDRLGDTMHQILRHTQDGTILPDSLDGQTGECGALIEEVQDNLRALMVASRAFAGIYRRAAENAPGDLANAQVKARDNVHGALR
jgi:hypothetical protein